MNKIWTFLSIFLLFSWASNSQEHKWINKMYDDILIVNELDVKGYINIFNEMFYQLNYVKGEDQNQIVYDIFTFDLIKIKFITFNDDTIAIAENPMDDEDVILVDPVKWIKLTPYQKCWLVSHEIGHEVFGLEHGEGGALMFPIMPNNPDFNDIFDSWIDVHRYIRVNNIERLYKQ